MRRNRQGTLKHAILDHLKQPKPGFEQAMLKHFEHRHHAITECAALADDSATTATATATANQACCARVRCARPRTPPHAAPRRAALTRLLGRRAALCRCVDRWIAEAQAGTWTVNGTALAGIPPDAAHAARLKTLRTELAGQFARFL